MTVGKTEVSLPSESFLSGAANFFCKGPNSKWFRLCWPCDISISMLLISNIKAATDRKETDECSKTLHMNTDVHVSCTFHIAQNSFNFLNHLKTWKLFLTCRPYQNRGLDLTHREPEFANSCFLQEGSRTGTPQAVQWLRFQVPNAGSLGSIPGQRTKCCN